MLKNNQIHLTINDEGNNKIINCDEEITRIYTSNTKDGIRNHHRPRKTRKKKITSYRFHCCTLCAFITGVFTLLLGILSFIYLPYHLFLEERLRMRPGLPPFEWWRNPEPEVLLKAHIFTVENSEEFLDGTDSKLKIKDFGPIIYREHLEHLDVEYHTENSTLSYTIHRYLEFLPDQNEPGILNRTITVTNIVLLGMVATIHDANFVTRAGFNIMSRKDQLFVNVTVYNYLWNFTTPALVTANNVVPFMVPKDNGGPLQNVYENFRDRVNVKIGITHGYSEFFKINTFNYRPTAPGYRPERGDCFASIQNSTEGALYPNFLTKDSVPYYWRKTVCRAIPLYFKEEIQKGYVLAYKFQAKHSMYDRFENISEDCYAESQGTRLPNGLSDVSKCYTGTPIAVSVPHFFGREGPWNDQLEGFTPNQIDHESYTIVEPVTGVPIEQRARSQSNMIIPKLRGFRPDIQKFSEMIVPMTWMEYHQAKLTPKIDAMLVFTVNILPWLQYVISVLLLTAAIRCFIAVFLRIKKFKYEITSNTYQVTYNKSGK